MDLEMEKATGPRAAGIIYPLFVGHFFGFLLTAATFMVVTRILGPAQYGVYVFAFGFSALVNAVSAFGIGTYWNRQLANLEYRKDGEGILRELSAGYVILIAIGILLSVFGIAISGYVAGIFPNVGIRPVTLELSSMLIIFLMVNTAAVNALIGLSRASLASISNILVDIVQLVLSVILTIMYGVNGAVEAMLIGYAFGAVITTYLIYATVIKYVNFRIRIPTRQELLKVLSFATPLAANNFLNTGMQNFSILLLGGYVVTSALGNYGAANKGMTLLSMIYGSFAIGLLTTFTTTSAMKKPEDINRTYNAIIKFSMVLTLPIVIFIGVMAVPGLHLLISSSFSTAPLYLTLMALGTMVGLFSTYISNLLISGNHTKRVLAINLTSSVVQLVLLVALVPYLHIVGAIIAIYFVGNLIEAALFALETKRKFRLTLEYKNLALLYASNMVLGLTIAAWLFASNGYLASAVPDIRYVIQIAIGLAVAVIAYPIILMLFRAVDMKDVSAMRNAARRLGKAGGIINAVLDYSEYVNGLVRRVVY